MPPRLAEVQQLLYRLITSPNGVEEGLAVENALAADGLSALICGDECHGSVDRLGIYADMYFYRLLDALKEDFPVALRIVGDVNFHNLITQYLVEYPPSHHSITEASCELARFAHTSFLAEEFPFLSDLIRLERAIIQVFLGPDADALSCEELRRTPAAQWPSLRFGLHPAAQLIDCNWRVDRLLRAIDDGKSVEAPLKEPRTILVWRCDTVRWRALERDERDALVVVCLGRQFLVTCESVASSDEKVTPAQLSKMLLQWVADGVVVKSSRNEQANVQD